MWKFFKSDGSEKRTALGESSLLAHAEFNAQINITATTEATAQTLVTAPPVVCDGVTPIVIDMFVPTWQSAGVGSNSWFYLYMDGVSLGLLTQITGGNTSQLPLTFTRKLTPSAGSHTFSLRAATSTATTVVYAGAGAIGTFAPGFIRITRDSNIGPQGIPGPPGIVHSCRAKNLVGQSMADLTPGIICTFEAEDWDTDGIHDNAVNPTRFTIPTGLPGLWLFDHHVEFPNPGQAHSVQSWLRKNGAGIVGGSGGVGNYGPANHVTHSLSIVDKAVAGDYYEFLIGFNLGATRTTIAMTGAATMLGSL